MKAIQIAVAGGPSVLNYVDVPTPSPGAGEVLGSGLIDHSQKMTTAAMQMADMNV